jgi:HlyD family secretion protein
MNVRIRRRIIISSLGAAALLALVYGFWPKPVPVDAAKATRGPFRVTIEEEGKTRVIDRFIVSAPVAGFIRRVELKAGSAVKKGDPLFILDPLQSSVLDSRSRAEAQAGAAAAQASVKAAEKKELSAMIDADYTADRLARFRRLLENDAVAKAQFDQIEAQAKQAQAVYLAAQAATHMARSELQKAESVLVHSAAGPRRIDQEKVVVPSPKAGHVLKVYRESEGAVAMGEPVMEIGDPRDIEVRVELLSADAVKIKPKMPVSFERWGGETILTGIVRTIEPSGFTKISSLGVEEQRVLVIADITSDPETRPRLGDGYRIEAGFMVWEGQNILQIPASAIFRAGEKWAVFKVEHHRARTQIVDVGQRNGLRAEILSGVSEGDLVVARPDDAIKDGSRIKVRTVKE